MSFKKHVVEFQKIIDRPRVHPRNEADLLGEIREECARAGRTLSVALDDQRIPMPEPSPNWLRFYLNPEGVRFREFTGPTGQWWSCPEGLRFEDLRDMLRTVQAESEEFHVPGGGASSKRSFVLRHIFLEAATSWAVDSEGFGTPSLPTWTAITTRGTSCVFVSDWLETSSDSGNVDLAMPLARACKRACEFLGRGARARRKQGRPRVSTPDDDERIARGWHESPMRRYEDYARAMGLTADDVRRAVDRDRKRRDTPRRNN